MLVMGIFLKPEGIQTTQTTKLKHEITNFLIWIVLHLHASIVRLRMWQSNYITQSQSSDKTDRTHGEVTRGMPSIM